ncbi:recombinase family protein [Eubacterium pyruvativorans]|uniref:recombinase family protein n=1 Tax=Eubacterium pyruvativorans TaxID=155865 RepID=UPI001568266E|nr:recombinase family protein [Eubacterium pyruvativorans]
MGKKITVIPQTKRPRESAKTLQNVSRRVCGYARVSTDSEEQATSYEAQLDYYSKFIRNHDGWEFAGMYSDEGITGTSTKKRDGFNRMVEDAMEGKVDLIVTKSVSRFARNTVDSLTTVRELKSAGVEVYFEKENLWTFDPKVEMVLTIMSSLAQEESRSISENTTWGKRKRFADGKVSIAYSSFLGYDKGPDGKMVINEEQAKIVKKIYRLFLTGLSYYAIAKILTEEGIPTPMGKEKWGINTVESILKNEKYKGDALLQKMYTVDFLTKKQKVNGGELPQYYVRGDHEAIIKPEIFDLVQEEIRRRKEGGRYVGVSIFSSKIICGDCGAYYGPKVWHSTDARRKKIWQCNDKFKGEKCHTPHLTESEIKEAFMKAANKLINMRKSVIEDAEVLRDQLADNAALEAKKNVINNEMESIVSSIKELIRKNTSIAQDQGEYRKQEEALTDRYKEKKAEVDEISSLIIKRKAGAIQLEEFVRTIRKADPTLVFNESLWAMLLQKMVVYSRERIDVEFRDGTVIKVSI